MRQIILLLFLASVLLSGPGSWADYDKNSISSVKTTDVAAASSATGKSAEKSSSTKLYGRIEEIVQSPGAQFPIVLHAQTAKLDTRQLSKQTQHGEASFSGVVVKSFPQQFTGIWGGNLKIWTSQLDPICWQMDAEEANRARLLLTSGREGAVNFNFSQDPTGAIDLEPARVIFMVPLKQTHQQQELDQALGQMGQANGGLTLPGMDAQQVSGMMKQVASNMNVPIIISFGSINDPNERSFSGNRYSGVVLKNSIRQLSPGVLEQQIVTRDMQHDQKTGKIRQEYGETVIRFTSQGANSLYVLAAAVTYTADHKFERKLILYGTVRKGQVMPDMTNPLSLLNNMMPNNGQLQQMSPGQNPFQNLFPH